MKIGAIIFVASRFLYVMVSFCPSSAHISLGITHPGEDKKNLGNVRTPAMNFPQELFSWSSTGYKATTNFLSWNLIGIGLVLGLIGGLMVLAGVFSLGRI
jgi:hypothetical protein